MITMILFSKVNGLLIYSIETIRVLIKNHRKKVFGKTKGLKDLMTKLKCDP